MTIEYTILSIILPWKINDSVISKIEKLAKLRFEGEERDSIKKDLEKMLDMVNKLEEVDTENVEPLVYIHEEQNVLRKDEVSNMIGKEQALENAPKFINGYFAVPKVLNK